LLLALITLLALARGVDIVIIASSAASQRWRCRRYAAGYDTLR